ncbi:N-acetyllactosaminide beta-1,3-N-acetylglucosaminyltransferase 2-like [Ciona intestinalis]
MTLASMRKHLQETAKALIYHNTPIQITQTTETTETTITTVAEENIDMPGLLSMDQDLVLPAAVPERPDSKEPILNYSQRRDYPVLIPQTSKCISNISSNKNVDGFDYEGQIFLLVAIKSSCNNKDRRNAIRKTWGDERWVKSELGVNMRRVFLLGACPNEYSQDKLIRENAEHEDIIQWNFQDSFRNLTLKECLYLQWFSKSCREVPYIFKGDDDVFVNIKNIVLFLKELPENRRTNLFVGSVLNGSPRILNPASKYYVSYNLFPERLYPAYVSGGGFVMSGAMAIRLFQASLQSRIIPIDDAFMGILVKKIGEYPQDDRGYKSWGMRNIDPCRLARIKTLHRMTPNQLIKAWSEYVKLDFTTCGKETADVLVTRTKR